MQLESPLTGVCVRKQRPVPFSGLEPPKCFPVLLSSRLFSVRLEISAVHTFSFGAHRWSEICFEEPVSFEKRTCRQIWDEG